MLVRYAEGQQRSGSLGATTASHNRNGQYLRPRSIPVNPNTDRQVDARNEFRAASIRWALELTQLQRDGWNVYAGNVGWLNGLGDPINLTGQNMYIRTNTSRKQVGLAVIDEAPGEFDLAPAELSLAVAASEASQDLDVSFDVGAQWVDEDDAYQAVYVGRPQNASRKFFGGPWKFAGVILGDGITAPTSPATIASPWPVIEGQRIWCQTRVGLADGRLSEHARANFLAGA